MPQWPGRSFNSAGLRDCGGEFARRGLVSLVWPDCPGETAALLNPFLSVSHPLRTSSRPVGASPINHCMIPAAVTQVAERYQGFLRRLELPKRKLLCVEIRDQPFSL